jgi:hypothetical protein
MPSHDILKNLGVSFPFSERLARGEPSAADEKRLLSPITRQTGVA